VSGYERDDSADLVYALEGAAEGGTVIVPAAAQMRRVAERFPWVEAISVSRTWPRGLRVDVVQARPVAVASFGGQAVLVSDSGRVLGPPSGGERLGGLQLRAAAPQAGADLPELERAALSLFATLPPKMAARIGELAVDRSGSVTATLADGPPLRLGRAERMVAKAKALRLMLVNVPGRDLAAATYIDLSVPENPALGLSSDAAGAAQ
jgi:cell division protein FtsQ